MEEKNGSTWAKSPEEFKVTRKRKKKKWEFILKRKRGNQNKCEINQNCKKGGKFNFLPVGPTRIFSN